MDLRLHWAFFLWPLCLTVLTVALAVTIVVDFPKAPIAVGVILAVLVAVPLLWLSGRLLRWAATSLVVTTERLMLRKGVVRRDLVQIRLQRIAEVQCQRTLLERLAGTGSLVVEVVDDDPLFIVRDVRQPRTLQRVLTRQLEPSGPEGRRSQPDVVRSGAAPPGPPVASPRSDHLPGHDDTPVAGGHAVGPSPGVAVPGPGGGRPEGPRATITDRGPDAQGHWPSLTPPEGMGAVPRATQTGIPEQIVQLDGLRRRGLLTDEEFEAKKTELLSRL